MCKSLPQGPKRQWLQMYDDLFIGSSVPRFNHDTFLGQDSFISRSSFWSLHVRKHWWDRVFGVWGIFQTMAKRYIYIIIYIHLQHSIYAPDWLTGCFHWFGKGCDLQREFWIWEPLRLHQAKARPAWDQWTWPRPRLKQTRSWCESQTHEIKPGDLQHLQYLLWGCDLITFYPKRSTKTSCLRS